MKFHFLMCRVGLKLCVRMRLVLRTPGAPELPMFIAASPSPTKGRKDMKGKGGVMEFSKEDTGMQGLREASIPRLVLSALLISSIRIAEGETKPSRESVEQLSEDRMPPKKRKRWIH
jgi:hypothetical protein